jgi:hypothetical protein
LITDLEQAVYQVLTEAQGAGEPLSGVPQILDNAMKLVMDGGLAVEGEAENFHGGSENRVDFVTGEVKVHAVVYIGRDDDYQLAKASAGQLAKNVRQVIKDNLALTSSQYPAGFSKGPVRISKIESGYTVHGGTRIAVATVYIEADYEESYS